MELQWRSEESVKQSSEMKNLYYQYLLSNMIPMELKLNEKEQEALKKSAEALKEVLEDLDI